MTTATEILVPPDLATRRPLKILHVTEASFAGVGGHVLDLASGLQQRGCANHVIFSPTRADDVFKRRLVDANLSGSCAVAMRRMPHWTDWGASGRIRRYIAEHGPFDVIHGHSTKGGGLARLRAVMQSASAVYTPNGIYTMNKACHPIAWSIVRRVENWLSHRSAAIVAVSPEERQHMIQIGLNPNRVHYIPNGLCPIQFTSREESRRRLSLDGEAMVIGFVGRLAPQKNPNFLLEAFAQLPSAIQSRARLAIVGEGPLDNELRTLSRRLGIEDRIRWLGFRKACECMRAFDLFTLPSRYEGMPYVLMEAVSAGLPIVTTAVGGATSCVDHGRNGFVVSQGNVAEFAEAIGKLASDPALCAEFSAASQVKASEFGVDQMVERTLELYWNLIRSRAGRAAENNFHRGPDRLG